MPSNENPGVEPKYTSVRVGRVSMNFSNKRVAGVFMEDDGFFRPGDKLQFGSDADARVITVTTIEQMRTGVTEARANQVGRVFGVFTGFRDNRSGDVVFRLDPKQEVGGNEETSEKEHIPFAVACG